MIWEGGRRGCTFDLHAGRDILNYHGVFAGGGSENFKKCVT